MKEPRPGPPQRPVRPAEDSGLATHSGSDSPSNEGPLAGSSREPRFREREFTAPLAGRAPDALGVSRERRTSWGDNPAVKCSVEPGCDHGDVRKIISLMNYNRQSAEASLDRDSATATATPINGNRSYVDASPAATSDRRAALGSGCGRSSQWPAAAPSVPDEGCGFDTIGLDLPAVAAALTRRLHTAGLPVTSDHAVDFAEALAIVNPASRGQLYHAARAVFVSTPVHLQTFDREFAVVFGRCSDLDGARAERARS